MATPTSTPNVTDNYSYTNSSPKWLCVQVISGSPVMSFSTDGWATETVLDLTVSATYPAVPVFLPACQFKFALSGAVVKVDSMSESF